MGSNKRKVQKQPEVWQWGKPKAKEAEHEVIKERVNPCHVCDCMYPCSSARSIKPWD